MQVNSKCSEKRLLWGEWFVLTPSISPSSSSLCLELIFPSFPAPILPLWPQSVSLSLLCISVSVRVCLSVCIYSSIYRSIYLSLYLSSIGYLTISGVHPFHCSPGAFGGLSAGLCQQTPTLFLCISALSKLTSTSFLGLAHALIVSRGHLSSPEGNS